MLTGWCNVGLDVGDRACVFWTRAIETLGRAAALGGEEGEEGMPTPTGAAAAASPTAALAPWPRTGRSIFPSAYSITASGRTDGPAPPDFLSNWRMTRASGADPGTLPVRYER